jgi:FkbM family methyltransferase
MQATFMAITAFPLAGTNIFFDLDPSFGIEKYLLESSQWEGHITSFLDYLLQPGNVCIDVGANFGFHALVMATKVGRAGKVVAFEPNTRIRQRLLRNMELNPTLKNVIECHEVGLGDCHASLKLFEVPGNGNAYIAEQYQKNLGGTEADFSTVKVVPFDDVFQLAGIDLIKIDVEGMEAAVLRGMQHTLKRCAPIVVFESMIGCFGEAAVKASTEILSALGYYFYRLDTKLGKLLPAVFPHFSEDTFAIHDSKIDKVVDVLLHATRLNVEVTQNSEATWGTSFEIVIAFVLADYPRCGVVGRVYRNDQTLTVHGRKDEQGIHFDFPAPPFDFSCSLFAPKEPSDCLEGVLTHKSDQAGIIARYRGGWHDLGLYFSSINPDSDSAS